LCKEVASTNRGLPDLSVKRFAGSRVGSGAVQDGAMGRKVLKVGHHAVNQLPYGTLRWLHTLIWEYAGCRLGG